MRLKRIAARVAAEPSKGFLKGSPNWMEDVDSDPDFRKVLDHLNDELGATTYSSCQGHLPGTQYEDVLETMLPYVSFEGDPAIWEPVANFLRSSPWADREGGPACVGLSESLIGHWDELLEWLKSQKSG